MEFSPFTVVAGANASGKSNLFDALKLLSRLAETDNLKKAFGEQRGEFIELFTQYENGEYASEMSFEVEMLVDKNIKDGWGNTGVLKYTRIRYQLKIRRFANSSGIDELAVFYELLESIKHKEDKWIKRIPTDKQDSWRPKVTLGKRGVPYITTTMEDGIPTVCVHQDGRNRRKRYIRLNSAKRTVLSSFDTVDFPHVLAAKEEMRSWRFLQLNPEDLRKPTHKRNGGDVITQTGKNLAGALYRIKRDDNYTLIEISRKLQQFLPHFTEVQVVDDVENSQFVIKLKDNKHKEYSSRVLSEGTLRILVLCVLEYDNKHASLLCFEEPENGIHPFRMKAMVELLIDLAIDFREVHMPLRQVIVNTHSPSIIGNLSELMKNRKWLKNIVGTWFAQMRNIPSNIGGKKMVVNATKMLPVVIGDIQLALPFSEEDKKMTLSKVKKYLQTADFEHIFKSN